MTKLGKISEENLQASSEKLNGDAANVNSCVVETLKESCEEEPESINVDVKTIKDGVNKSLSNSTTESKIEI